MAPDLKVQIGQMDLNFGAVSCEPGEDCELDCPVEAITAEEPEEQPEEAAEPSEEEIEAARRAKLRKQKQEEEKKKKMAVLFVLAIIVVIITGVGLNKMKKKKAGVAPPVKGVPPTPASPKKPLAFLDSFKKKKAA